MLQYPKYLFNSLHVHCSFSYYFRNLDFVGKHENKIHQIIDRINNKEINPKIFTMKYINIDKNLSYYQYSTYLFHYNFEYFIFLMMERKNFIISFLNKNISC